MKLAINIIARDGAKDLPALLSKLTFADEIVIALDDRTVDNTREVCVGCKVIDYHWEASTGFAGARNCAIENTTADMICFFDCDDRLDNVDALVAFAKGKATNNIYTFGVKNVPGDSVFQQVRMFPNKPCVRFSYRIHETLAQGVIDGLGGTIENFPLTVMHHGYIDPSEHKRKLARNLPLVEAEIKSGSFCPTLVFTYAMNLMSLSYMNEAKYWLEKNIDDRVINSNFRDVALFSILNIVKILMAQGKHAEAEAYMLTGFKLLPDFCEMHLCRATTAYLSGDYGIAAVATLNAEKCPQRSYAVATDYGAVNVKIKELKRLLKI